MSPKPNLLAKINALFDRGESMWFGTLDLWNVTCALDLPVSTPIFWPCQRQMNYL